MVRPDHISAYIQKQVLQLAHKYTSTTSWACLVVRAILSFCTMNGQTVGYSLNSRPVGTICTLPFPLLLILQGLITPTPSILREVFQITQNIPSGTMNILLLRMLAQATFM